MLNRVEVGAIGGEVHKSYIVNIVFPPISYTLEMMIFGIIYRHDCCFAVISESMRYVEHEVLEIRGVASIGNLLEQVAVFRVLRHSFICNLVMSGMNVKKVQYLAGHKDLRMTLGVYTKLMENKPENLIEDIKKVFS